MNHHTFLKRYFSILMRYFPILMRYFFIGNQRISIIQIV